MGVDSIQKISRMRPIDKSFALTDKLNVYAALAQW